MTWPASLYRRRAECDDRLDGTLCESALSTAALQKAAVGKGTVLVRRYLNSELHFCYRDRELLYTLLPERPKPKTVVQRKSKEQMEALNETQIKINLSQVCDKFLRIHVVHWPNHS